MMVGSLMSMAGTIVNWVWGLIAGRGAAQGLAEGRVSG